MTLEQARILVVDDDEAIIEITRRSLEAEGYRVHTVSDGHAAIEAAMTGAPDVMVLDIMLPGLDGFEVTREIRKKSNVPIILLTAKSDTVDVIVGLESGADDYVTKPFDMKELVARIRSLLRRVKSGIAEADESVRLGDIEVRVDEGRVLKQGLDLSLTKTEFLLLVTLASKPGKVFSREQLLREVWGYDYFGDGRLVDVHVRRLRSKIEDDASDPAMILTVRGLGYKLAGVP